MYGNASFSRPDDFFGESNVHTASPTQDSPYSVSSETRSTDLRGMEDSLRKILKLDSTGSSSINEPGIGSVPAAAVSVPNYVGGRPPPMNGMHNGVIGS
jgi:hypothetical protein